ncbi:MAG: hypothetical protein R3342_09085 [Lutibacter sp.]|uniref:hypothetical protein n=1 Tax=Lutibacter sp. TaxID=1925666 RepID=UPI00299EA951|nr:hypothetical protein [Lutibacter sp.]MDX1829686.1 hypothetical protein [Lutibacter sp.]
MKKDIKIPEVSNVFIAAVKEYNEEFKCDDWNTYIINAKEIPIEMILIVSKGYDETKGIETAVLRHKIEKLPANSFAKIELLQNEVLKLTNFFNVTFFEGNKMFDKKYVFKKGIIKEGNLRQIPMLNKRGILIK